MKRLLAVLVLAGASVNAQTYINGDWQYIVENGEATITNYIGNGGAVEIPSEVNGTPVKKIGGGTWVFGWGNTTITSITIPNGVTSLGNGAFDGMRNLFYLFLPSTVTNIGNLPFSPTTTVMTDPLLQKIANNETFVSSVTTNNSFVTALANNSEFIAAVATNDAFVTAVANKILAASNNYGLATKTEVGGAVTMGVQQVLSAPSDYNLFTTQQVQSERTAGQSDVLNSPNSFSLYTTNQIHNLGLGGIVLNRNTNNQLVLNYQVLQSADLQNWSPYQQSELVITNAPSDKMFLRVQAFDNAPYSSPLNPAPAQPEGEGTASNSPSPVLPPSGQGPTPRGPSP